MVFQEIGRGYYHDAVHMRATAAMHCAAQLWTGLVPVGVSSSIGGMTMEEVDHLVGQINDFHDICKGATICGLSLLEVVEHCIHGMQGALNLVAFLQRPDAYVVIKERLVNRHCQDKGVAMEMRPVLRRSYKRAAGFVVVKPRVLPAAPHACLDLRRARAWARRSRGAGVAHQRRHAAACAVQSALGGHPY